MPYEAGGKASTGKHEACLEISLKAATSHLKASDGRDIPFTRAILAIDNVCPTDVIGIVPHATLGQEGGTVQDVSSAFSGAAPEAIPPGEGIRWDVYDLLLPAHPGTASKVHMFGYRAALNWRFDLEAWVEFRHAVDAPVVRTPPSRWSLRWSVPDPASGAVTLSIEERKD